MKKKLFTTMAAIVMIALAIGNVKAQEPIVGLSEVDLMPSFTELMRMEDEGIINVASTNGSTATTTVTVTTGSTAEGVLPGNEDMPEPFAILTHFITGTNILDPTKRHLWEPELMKIVEALDHEVFVIVHGEASLLDYNVCYMAPDFSYVVTSSMYRRNPAKYMDAIKVTGNDNCNRVLAYSRAVAIRDMVAEIDKKKSERVIPLRYAAYGNRPGTNYHNQAAVAFVISRDRVNMSEGPVIEACPDCAPPIFDFDLPPGCGYFITKVTGGYKVAIVCIDCPNCQVPEPTTPRTYERSCWEEGLIGVIPGGLIGWGVSTINVEGGEGAGNAGDGGDVNFCAGENQAACIASGAAFGYFSAVGICEWKRHREQRQSTIPE